MATYRKIILATYYVLVVSLFPLSSLAADLCFCPEKPTGSECNGNCIGNPGGVVVILPNKPGQPGTNPFEQRDLWSKKSLERFRQNNEKYRLLLESRRVKSEATRIQEGQYPPSSDYVKSMSDYFKGIEHYKYNINQYNNLQKSMK